MRRVGNWDMMKDWCLGLHKEVPPPRASGSQVQCVIMSLGTTGGLERGIRPEARDASQRRRSWTVGGNCSSLGLLEHIAPS